MRLPYCFAIFSLGHPQSVLPAIRRKFACLRRSRSISEWWAASFLPESRIHTPEFRLHLFCVYLFYCALLVSSLRDENGVETVRLPFVGERQMPLQKSRFTADKTACFGPLSQQVLATLLGLDEFRICRIVERNHGGPAEAMLSAADQTAMLQFPENAGAD